MTASAGSSRKKDQKLTPFCTALTEQDRASAPWVEKFTSRNGVLFCFQEKPKAKSSSPSTKREGSRVEKNCSAEPAQAGGTDKDRAARSTVTEDESAVRVQGHETQAFPEA